MLTTLFCIGGCVLLGAIACCGSNVSDKKSNSINETFRQDEINCRRSILEEELEKAKWDSFMDVSNEELQRKVEDIQNELDYLEDRIW